MFKPDLIVCWPQHLDYPLWREFIHDNRSRFYRVIVVFTNMNTDGDYRQWIKDVMAQDDIAFMHNDSVSAEQDWRNVAVNKALSYSKSEWVFFTEQDFIPKGNFWKEVDDMAKRVEVFGYFQEGRLHPCCIFIKREMLDKTHKDFGVVKDELDHFGRLQQDLENEEIIIGMIPSYLGHHLNGLSQNMWMLQHGEEPNYQPEEFKEYCKKSLEVTVPLHPDIVNLMQPYIKIND